MQPLHRSRSYREPSGEPRASQRTTAWIVVALVAIVVVIFGRTASFDFLDYDDPDYIYENPHVMGGLTLEGVGWAFTHAHAANWHPLTWISHMADWELYGSWAGGHHLTNVVIHAANAVLLFLALRRLTGGMWPSAFVAAVFAIHPLHVESVAWVAERKDVLSGLFFMLTLLAYAEYVKRPTRWGYAWVAVALAAGLLAKPMLVTLPFVLLLLDYWPLGRFGSSARLGEARRAVLEKIPLLALAIASSVATVVAQRKGGALRMIVECSPLERVANGLVSYVMYLAQSACPVGLAVFYPHPAYTGDRLPFWGVGGAGGLLLAASAAAIALRRRYPYLPVGWFWFLGMLVPVIGVIQVGAQARADRYTYLPQIGLCIAVAWFAKEVIPTVWLRRIAVVVLLALAGLAWQQTDYWQDTEALFGHTLDVTHPTWITHTTYGGALAKKEKFEEGMAHLRAAYEIDPSFPRGRQNMAAGLTLWGNALAKQGRMEAAAQCFESALSIKPESVQARKLLVRVVQSIGLDHAARGRPEEAAACFRRSVQLDPSDPSTHYNLGWTMMNTGHPQEALACFRRVLELEPDNSAARKNVEMLTRTVVP